MKVVIISGFFNPLHGGHLDMIEAAALMGDKLVVIVNNDAQQVIKKGKVILNEQNRARLIGALRAVDETIISVDEDPTVIRSLQMVATQHPDDELVFANGGDRDSEKVIPETEVCKKYGIKTVFGVGTEIRGLVKPDSSSRINKELGHEK